MEVLTTELDDGTRMLPVFAFEEEAEIFLRLGVEQSGWRVRESKAGELISVLCGPCKDIELVAFDPLPKIRLRITVEPMSVGRNEFLEFLLHKDQSAARSNAKVTRL